MAITKADAREAEKIRQRHLAKAEEVKERTRRQKAEGFKPREVEVTRTDADGRTERPRGKGPQVSVVPPPDPSEDPTAVALDLKVPAALAEQLAHRAQALDVSVGTLVAGILRENVNAPFATPSVGRNV